MTDVTDLRVIAPATSKRDGWLRAPAYASLLHAFGAADEWGIDVRCIRRAWAIVAVRRIEPASPVRWMVRPYFRVFTSHSQR